jgi:signal transduction histidine kinase
MAQIGSAPKGLRFAAKAPAPEPELRDPTKFGIILASLNVVLYSLMSVSQWIGWGGLYTALSSPGITIFDALTVMAINLATGFAVVAGVFALRPWRFPAFSRYLLIAGVAAVGAVPRVLALASKNSTPDDFYFIIAEWAAGFLAATVAVAAGVLTSSLVGRARREQMRSAAEAARALQASEELRAEEMRVRRSVAGQLHGSLQYRLVAVTAGLDATASELSAAGQTCVAARVADFAEEVDEIRDSVVRDLSHSVFPAGIELGAMTAIEAMLHRLPPQITWTINIGDRLAAMTKTQPLILKLADRLIAVFAIEEAITNAMKHGHANNLVIDMDVVDRTQETTTAALSKGTLALIVSVEDDGVGLGDKPGFNMLSASKTPLTGDEQTSAPNGLVRQAERIVNRGGYLKLAPKAFGGSRFEFSLPFEPTLP